MVEDAFPRGGTQGVSELAERVSELTNRILSLERAVEELSRLVRDQGPSGASGGLIPEEL